MSNAPDHTITANPHAFVHCGAVTHEGIDDKRDLTVITSSNNSIIHYKNGNKNERIQGNSSEVVGISGDKTQKGAKAKSIVAQSGDIHIDAENGDIYLKAKNIYMLASDEGNGTGNIMATCNGYLQLSTGGEFRVGAGRMCFVTNSNMNFVGQMMVTGGMHKIGASGSVASAGFLKNILSGNWADIVKAVTQSCK